MATYSFKSSGLQNRRKVLDRIDQITLRPIGIKTPLEFSKKSQDSLFAMHYDIATQIHDNLRNLLLTNPGERLGRHDYGAGLREMTMEMLSSEDYEYSVMMRIKATVEKYMPFVDLDSFTVEDISGQPYALQTSMSKVTVIVTYNVPKISIVGRKLQLNLFVAG
jgi:phage baseplate assembly protein W